MPQYLHEAVLRKHVESLGGKIDVGVTFVGLQQDETGVAVELAETKNGNKTSEKSQYDWVVGTDGGRSSCSTMFYPSYLRLGQVLFANAWESHSSGKPKKMKGCTSRIAKSKALKSRFEKKLIISFFCD